MRRPKYKTRYLTKARAKQIGVNLSAYPNAGPNPSVWGMKAKYWGYDAFCVRQGNYVYKVPRRVWAAAY